MRNERYLVTGGAGFIGSHIVEHLAAQGATVVVYDNFSTGRWSNLEAVQGRTNVRVVEASLLDADALGAALEGIDYVLHLAALNSVSRSVQDPVETERVNVEGTIRLLWAAARYGVRRFVFSSSSSVYGDTPTLPKSEEMIPQPRSPYAITKHAGECYCRVFSQIYGLPTVCLRYFNVFGPRQDPQSEYAAVVPRFVSAVLRGVPPTIYGDGEQTRDFTYVENVVRANLLAVRGPAAQGEAYNIGSGARVSITQLAQAIKRLVGRPDLPVRHVDPRPGDVLHSLAALERARQDLGYRVWVDLEEGLRRVLASAQD